MLLLLPTSIVVAELEPVKELFSIETVVKAARKAKAGLGESIKGAPAGGRFLKVYLTGKTVAGRALFFLRIKEDQLIPLLLRSKNDKVGTNITPSNKQFVAAVNKNLRLAINDLAEGRFEILEI